MYAQYRPFTYTYLDIIIWRIQLQEEKLLSLGSLGAALKVFQSASGEPREIGIQSMLNNAHPRGIAIYHSRIKDTVGPVIYCPLPSPGPLCRKAYPSI